MVRETEGCVFGVERVLEVVGAGALGFGILQTRGGRV